MSWLSYITDLKRKVSWAGTVAAVSNGLSATAGALSDLTNAETTATVARYLSTTTNYFFDQISTIPRVIDSLITHRPTRIIAGNVLRIAVIDLMPLVLWTYTNQVIQEKNDNPNQEWLSFNTMTNTLLNLSQAATVAITIRQNINLFSHILIVTIKASTFNKSTPTTTVCTEANCTQLDRLEGLGRNLVVFWLTGAAIKRIGNIPRVGPPLAALLMVYHYGRYILTVRLAELCDDHQLIYLREHPELVLALGLGAAASAAAANSLVGPLFGSLAEYIPAPEWIMNPFMETATPPILYSTINQLMLIMHMGVAAHMTLPEPKSISTRTTVDPVWVFQDGVSFLVDAEALGVQTKVQRLFEKRQLISLKERILQFKDSVLELDWPTYNRRIGYLVDHTQWITHIIIPSLFHDLHSFVNDPIIQPEWKSLQATLVHVLKAIENSKDDIRVQIATAIAGVVPEVVTRKAVRKWFGIPEAATKLLLPLLHSQTAMERLIIWRQLIEAIQPEIEPETKGTLLKARLLSGQEPAPPALQAKSPASMPDEDKEPVVRPKLSLVRTKNSLENTDSDQQRTGTPLSLGASALNEDTEPVVRPIYSKNRSPRLFQANGATEADHQLTHQVHTTPCLDLAPDVEDTEPVVKSRYGKSKRHPLFSEKSTQEADKNNQESDWHLVKQENTAGNWM